jgi:hypothetical protein
MGPPRPDPDRDTASRPDLTFNWLKLSFEERQPALISLNLSGPPSKGPPRPDPGSDPGFRIRTF